MQVEHYPQDFCGPLPRLEHTGKAWEQTSFLGEVECPTCTFINTRGTSLCEICQSVLSSFMWNDWIKQLT